MVSTAAMASGVTTWCAWLGQSQSITELMPFMIFLVHSYTCCSHRHASQYWTFIGRWILMGFTPSLYCSSLVHVASTATIFTLLLCHRVAYLHCTVTCQPLFKLWGSLPTYKTIELCLSHFYGFHLTLPHITNNTDKIVFSQQRYRSDNMRQLIYLFMWHCAHQQHS
jgi:hypothetical protein